jgi:hypothetical protein
MRLGLVHINMGPMSWPDALVRRARPRRPEDLATAGRVLAIVTARANAELADPELS